MAHEDIVFNGKNFIENLPLILRKIPTSPTAMSAVRDYMDSFGGFGSNGFFETFRTDTNPFRSWDGFLAAWRQYSMDPTDGLLNAFVADFKTRIAYEDGPPQDSEWWALSAALQGTGVDEDGFPLGVTDALIAEYFQRAFGHFLSTYPYVDEMDEMMPPAPGNVGIVGNIMTASDNFFLNWDTFTTVTSQLDDATTQGGGGLPDLASYSAVYSVFFPQQTGETLQEFNARYYERIREFWKEHALENGAGSAATAWFIPSHNFDEWFEDLREEFLRGDTVKSTQLFTVSTPATERVLVIDRILRLLVEMIDVLQRLSAAQAQRLSFLTTWQQAYTDLITQVPQFTAGDGTPLGQQGNEAENFRNQVANPLMQSILEKVRARRSAVQDEAKQMQTTINQSQDSANQQTQMATSLLQQLSTILSQIFR